MAVSAVGHTDAACAHHRDGGQYARTRPCLGRQLLPGPNTGVEVCVVLHDEPRAPQTVLQRLAVFP